jgi:hypothetical protein
VQSELPIYHILIYVSDLTGFHRESQRLHIEPHGSIKLIRDDLDRSVLLSPHSPDDAQICGA